MLKKINFTLMILIIMFEFVSIFLTVMVLFLAIGLSPKQSINYIKILNKLWQIINLSQVAKF